MQAVFSNIIVQPQNKEEETHGSWIIPDLGKEVGLRGTVISVGPGQHTVTGEFIPTTIKVGDNVLLPPIGPVKIEVDNKQYWTCHESLVIATF